MDPPEIKSDRTLRQEIGCQKWVDSGCRATLQYCTGFGKTSTALICIARFIAKNPMRKIVVIVPTEQLKTQWIGILDKKGYTFNIEVIIINTAIKSNFFCDFLVLDEIHLYAAESFYRIFEVCNPHMILGLTATFERLDGKEKLIAQHCPVCDVITVKEATSKGWLATYTEYKVMLDVDLSEYHVVNGAFMDHFAFFDYQFNTVMACMTGIKKGGVIVKYPKQCIKEYAKFINPDPRFEKQTIAETTAHTYAWGKALKERKAFVKNHPKKIEISELILANRLNSKALTFNATIEQCEKFSHGYVIHSGSTKKKNKLTMEEFCSLDVGVAHTSKILNAGADVPGLNLAIINSNSSSSTERIQRIGRIIRKEGDKHSEVFSLILRGTMEENWFKKSSVGLSHIEIDEDELIEMLSGKPLEQKREVVQEKQQYLFTF